MVTETELTLIILDLTEQISEVPLQGDTLLLMVIMGSMTAILIGLGVTCVFDSPDIACIAFIAALLGIGFTYNMYDTYMEIPVMLEDFETQRLYYLNLYESLYGPFPQLPSR